MKDFGYIGNCPICNHRLLICYRKGINKESTIIYCSKCNREEVNKSNEIGGYKNVYRRESNK